MSSTKITVLALCMVAVVAACAKKEEVVYVDEQAVTVEPTDTGKYKLSEGAGISGRAGSARPFHPCRGASRFPRRVRLPVCHWAKLCLFCRDTHRVILENNMRTTALISILAAGQADFPVGSAYLFATGRSFAYSAATRTVSYWRITCGPLPLSPCWLLPPSQLARSPRPSLKLHRCRSNRHKPANTNNQTGQAPYGSAPFGRLPVGMVASC